VPGNLAGEMGGHEGRKGAGPALGAVLDSHLQTAAASDGFSHGDLRLTSILSRLLAEQHPFRFSSVLRREAATPEWRRSASRPS